MKFLVWFAISLCLNFALGIFFAEWLPWWYIVITGLGIGYLCKLKPRLSFLLGTLSVFILWFAYSYWLDKQGGAILSPKLTELFAPLTSGSTLNLFLITGIIGGLVSGIATLTGALFYTNFTKKISN